ncbi:nodulation protein NodH [Ruegeria sp. ANG-S4]|uniref:sulfotransferase family 2 domain-containing protein n=1 Tax=Ruegeria sp. ANG-S4 TaxID=1577904 RepID=UPI00057F987E|nr:sulfotransferase family 2 domain-containing protein [Ruegeria sp. ANG-S4]KIC40897.1 nodulation protein NodH [Ruegeria sp. ANG-S4]
MTPDFDYFIVLADMRTGSNLLEQHLNSLDGVTCFGEAFNPYFVGLPKLSEMLGFTPEIRDRDPLALIDAIRAAPGELNGFRFFSDHDARALEPALDDHRCAKIILTRNPLDSYISWKIAVETKQWRLVNIKQRREAQITFDAEEFTEQVDLRRTFQHTVLNHLQKTGQTPFYIAYEDLNDTQVLNGLTKWLGIKARFAELEERLRRQNPASALSKVTNPADVEAAVSGLDRFNLYQVPNYEPRRGPAVSRHVCAAKSPLMYLPVRGGPEPQVAKWLADLDGVGSAELLTERSQKQVRDWMQSNPGHRKFTVLRHPLARAHSVFCTRILSTGPDAYVKIRNMMRNRYKLPIPETVEGGEYSEDQHHAAFSAFLQFLQNILTGQTPIRVDGLWCSQAQMLEGMAAFALPDLILREEDLATALPDLARQVGHTNPPKPVVTEPDTPFELARIYDAKLEALARKTYQRDYLLFGFSNWSPITGAE